ncbi:LysR family transcriptional regulator [Spongiibacter sp.]|uniref:LysR family transcriptional regulator n=1 Tax=Spongiibacter sp. TaxID=2024860 RepID=UPI000C37F3D2|nr:LysR family transcriptional regulator [Spongiibacter sp.]MBU71681.1 LysR family transcriptional regulator [Spongiibacter sp.]
MDRLDAMRTFVSVVNEGGFSRAAERLDKSPQLVSKYVAALEKQLGTRLLRRTTRRISLTEAGQAYFQRVQQVLFDIDDMESQLGDYQQQAQGLLRISAPVSFAISHMGTLICDFQRAYPAIDIDLQLNDRKVDIVEEGFDVALRIGQLKSSSLIAKRLAPVRILLCASPDYLDRCGRPTQPEELAEHCYLRYSYIEDEGDLSQYWRRKGPGAPAASVVSNNGDLLVQAAINGGGIALQPSFIAGPAIAAGQLEVVLPQCEPEPLGLYAVYAHRQLQTAKLRCFLDFIDGYFGSPPYWDAFE